MTIKRMPKRGNGNGAPILDAVTVQNTPKSAAIIPPNALIAEGPLPGLMLFKKITSVT